jgi:menaquinol-cytochrome c reductase iron-sulfur subunit
MTWTIDEHVDCFACAEPSLPARSQELETMDRRRALGFALATTGSLLAAGVVGIPTLLSALSPALSRRNSSWRIVGRLSNFPIARVTEGVLQDSSRHWPRGVSDVGVFVWRRSDADLVVFSRSCTDLGCPLDYQAGSGCYFCPCHGGIFGPDGRRLAGPPKAPMHRYQHRVREGVLEVDSTSIPPAA